MGSDIPQSQDHDLRLISESRNGRCVGAAGGYHQPAIIHTMVVFREESLPRCENASVPYSDLTTMAVAGKDKINRILPQLGVILRVMTQKNLASGHLAEARKEVCIDSPGELLRGYASKQYALDLHTTVMQQHNIRSLEGRFIFLGQVQLMVAQAHHHRGDLAGFYEEPICVLLLHIVLLPPAKPHPDD